MTIFSETEQIKFYKLPNYWFNPSHTFLFISSNENIYYSVVFCSFQFEDFNIFYVFHSQQKGDILPPITTFIRKYFVSSAVFKDSTAIRKNLEMQAMKSNSWLGSHLVFRNLSPGKLDNFQLGFKLFWWTWRRASCRVS